MKTLQRLDNYQALRITDILSLDNISLELTVLNSGWQIVDGPATMSISGNNYFASNYYVININVSGSAPIILRLNFTEENSPFFEADIEQKFVFTCVMQCTDGSPQVEAKLCNLNAACDQFNSRTLVGSKWDAVRSNVMILDSLDYDLDAYGITLTITHHSPNYNSETGSGLSRIFVSTPNLVNDSAWANNPVIQNMRPYIPDLYESYDSQEVDPTWPFFRLVDVLTDTIADTMFLYSEWFQHEKSELPANFDETDLSTRSRLTDYVNVRTEYIDWLGQFSGNKITKQIYNSSNSGIVTNTDLFRINQMNPAIYGRGAGNKSSIVSAAEFGLDGTKQVVVSQRYDAGSGESPWNILVSTLGSETIDVDYRGQVKVASSVNVDIANGLMDGSTVDGEALATDDKVLLKNQTDLWKNGVYTVVASGSASRSTDFDTGWDGTSGEIKGGATWAVAQGTFAEKSFTVSNSGVITLGLTAIDFELFAGSENILLLVENARPMGYKIYHKIVDEFTLTLGDTEFGVLGTAVL